MRPHIVTVAAISLIGAVLALALTSAAQPREICDNRTTRAVVLSGGGFRGAFEAGAIYHLVVHRGCDFQEFAGVSAGALNAAFLAQAKSPPDPLDSLKNLKDQTRELVKLWKETDSARKSLKPRFWGLKSGFVGIFLFDTESVYYLDPQRDRIRAKIKLDLLKVSGRVVRVGVVSFWDDSYQEIVFLSADRLKDDQFLDYVLASTAMPVLSEMPRIREEPGQPADDDLWAQFADGGVRHTTPIPGYFCGDELQCAPSSKGKGLIVFDKKVHFKFKDEEPEHVPPHDSVDEVFVILTFPHTPAGGRPLRGEPDRHMRGGKAILEKAHRLALLEPTRWDVRFGHLANEMLRWRESVYGEAKLLLSPGDFETFTKKLNSTFPIESFNRRPGVGHSLAYNMRVISPKGSLPEPSPDSCDISGYIAEQLESGCRTANQALMKEGFHNLEDRCNELLADGK